MSRIITYVDGFNLYHGAKELMGSSSNASTWKWLDLFRLSTKLCPNDEVVKVKYFTARVKSLNPKSSTINNQHAYLRALATQPHLETFLGQFDYRKSRMPLVNPPNLARYQVHRQFGLPLRRYEDGNISIPVWRTEEKATDVNLGSHLISDAFRDHFDTALVISNDSDLCEPIRLTTHDLGKKVIVVNPRGHRQQSVSIKNVASEVRNLRAAALTASQLPHVLHDEFGTIHKPEDW